MQNNNFRISIFCFIILFTFGACNNVNLNKIKKQNNINLTKSKAELNCQNLDSLFGVFENCILYEDCDLKPEKIDFLSTTLIKCKHRKGTVLALISIIDKSINTLPKGRVILMLDSLAQLGETKASDCLMRYYFDKRNINQIKKYLLISKKNGSKDAEFDEIYLKLYGKLKFSANENIIREFINEKEAIKLLHNLAEKENYGFALIELGALYYDGALVGGKDMKKSYSLLKKAMLNKSIIETPGETDNIQFFIDENFPDSIKN
jgi:hypothetical protein